MSPGCMFSVAMIQRFRLPPATRAMSADLHREPTAGGRGGAHRRWNRPGPGLSPCPALACKGRIGR